MKNFEKKFKDKTKNNWKDRESFNPVAGKYTLIEVEGDETEEEAAATAGKVCMLNPLRMGNTLRHYFAFLFKRW